ncbi:MAG: porin family protein [Bacteroidota bacterium]|nr:porin family protein [Bacteroidota bacterium]MDP4234003.1 porin family protein [Bacteroidota bacterium]MDP4242870.1 porin family protein [Bacteroidota bacterium]MDP4287692.1 porin family protein [Bacteroidota bacterium]
MTFSIRSLSFVLVLLGFSRMAQAQSDNMRTLRHAATPHTWIGVRGGLNLAGESVDDSIDASSTGMRAGFIGGVQVDEWLDNMWAISTGAMIDQKGVHEEYASHAKSHPNLSGNDDFTFTYLEVPILLRAAFGNGDARPYLFAGPSIGFLMSASETVSDSVKPTTGLKDHLSSTDLSIFFGAGFMEKLSDRTMLSIDAGYALGLSKVYKTPPESLINNGDAKSSDIRVAVAFLYGL